MIVISKYLSKHVKIVNIGLLGLLEKESFDSLFIIKCIYCLRW